MWQRSLKSKHRTQHPRPPSLYKGKASGGVVCNAECRTVRTKQKRSLTFVSDLGAPEGTRTPDLLIRSQTLYPAELPAHILLCVPLENVFYYSVIRGESQPFFSKNFEKKVNGQLALNFAGQGRAFRPFVVDCWGTEN